MFCGGGGWGGGRGGGMSSCSFFVNRGGFFAGMREGTLVSTTYWRKGCILPRVCGIFGMLECIRWVSTWEW